MPSLTTLAPELLLEIFTHLLPDTYSLLQSALVSRILLPYAREVLFRDTRLVETTRSADRTRQFSELLQSNHSLGPCIHTLRLELDLSRRREAQSSSGIPPFQMFFEALRISYREQWYDPSHYPDVVGALSLSRLPELRALVLGEGIILPEPVDQVVTVLKMLPRLERLSLRGVRAGTTRRAGASPDAAEPVAGPLPLPLKDLEIESLSRFPVRELAQRLLRLFRGTLALESLVVRCRDWEEVFAHHAAWIPFVSATAESLRCVNISTGELYLEKPSTDGAVAGGVHEQLAFHTDLLDVLRRCRSLRILRLDYLLPNHNEPSILLHRADFLRSLCVLLEGKPEFADHLEELSLRMVDWHEVMVSVDRPLGNRLARVLLDPSRYPRLKALQVRVRVEDAMFSDDDELPPLEKEEDRAIEGRWREAFTAFDKAAAGFAFNLEIERSS